MFLTLVSCPNVGPIVYAHPIPYLSLARAAASIICRHKHAFVLVATKHVFCRDKTRLLSRQKYACCDKIKWYLWLLSPVIHTGPAGVWPTCGSKMPRISCRQRARCVRSCVCAARRQSLFCRRPSFHRRFAPASQACFLLSLCRDFTTQFLPGTERTTDHATDSVVLPVTEVSRSIITDWSKAVRPTQTDFFLGSSVIDWDIGYGAWLQYSPRQQ